MKYVNTSQQFNLCLGAEDPIVPDKPGNWKLVAVSSLKADPKEHGFSWLVYTWELQPPPTLCAAEFPAY